MSINLAIIDLGSNSCRLRVTKVFDNGRTELIRYEKEYVRLSENMGPEKVLQPAPIERTIATLTRFKNICTELKNVRLIAVATAAVRQAVNQDEFLKRVKNELNIQFKILSGAREAYLDYVGVSRTLKIENGLIIDTGGASMEMILVDQGQAEELVSLPIGSVTLSQNYHLNDQVRAADLYDATIKVDEQLSTQRWLNRARHTQVIALGGSNRALAKMYRWKLATDPATVQPVHGLTMQTNEANQMMHELLATDRDGRAAIRGINSSRADVIIGGLLPLMALLRQLNLKELRFSNNGLREGLLFEYLDHEIEQSQLQEL
ncbi:Ppx/GppA family phosphatase [uncultured Limosilactobacillus sp.]|uniref:Ppx/GppA family phosphatase n=1 Tax=uncultured Limosilactobacillus sp. TaxID=2837629 RepID=UPI0025F5A077|nr:Ppx/GppA family phosphatase [uncultured Limosilactobacillus sp.]